MLLGHWYLVQPGLARGPLLELVRWTGITWPVEVVAMLLPTGMVSVLDGSIDDGYGGMLGWFWIACAVGTIALVVVTRAALQERYYSAVMAATRSDENPSELPSLIRISYAVFCLKINTLIHTTSNI